MEEAVSVGDTMFALCVVIIYLSVMYHIMNAGKLSYIKNQEKRKKMTIYIINYRDRDGYPCELLGEINEPYHIVFDGRKIPFKNIEKIVKLPDDQTKNP